MNNIDLYIQELETAKVEIKEAIIAKGVTPEGGLSSYADAIDSITIPDPTFEELSVQLTENGTYNYNPTADGYSSVEVTVDVEIPTFETQIKDVTITSNGNVNIVPDSGFDGLSEVNISVEVPTSGGGKPKIYNGFRFSGNNVTGSVNAFRQIDFSQYDWSSVYDTGDFFADFCKSNSVNDGWVDADFENFRQHYNGKMLNCNYLFYIDNNNANYASLLELPNFGDITNGCCSMIRMCYNQKKMTSADNIAKWNTKSVLRMDEMFDTCIQLTEIPMFDTSNVTNMNKMFNACTALTSIPQLDTSKVTTMSYMFGSCSSLTSVPQLDMSKVTTISNMFYGCTSLTELPDCNTKSMQTWSNWLPPKVQKVGVIDCDSTTNVQGMLTASTVLTEMGGFRNLGILQSVSNTNSNYFLYNVPNLTYESLINIFNLLYDRASAGYSVLTLKLSTNQMSKLSDDDKLIAINKGWSLTV